MVGLYLPRLERHYFVQLGELRQSWVNFLHPFRYPFQFTTIQYELLLQNIQQIVAFIATYCHDAEVELLIQLQNASVIRAASNHLIIRVSVELQILWEPAQNPLVGPYSTMLVEYTVKQFLKLYFGLIVLIKHFVYGEIGVFSDYFACRCINVTW